MRRTALEPRRRCVLPSMPSRRPIATRKCAIGRATRGGAHPPLADRATMQMAHRAKPCCPAARRARGVPDPSATPPAWAAPVRRTTHRRAHPCAAPRIDRADERSAGPGHTAVASRVARSPRARPARARRARAGLATGDRTHRSAGSEGLLRRARAARRAARGRRQLRGMPHAARRSARYAGGVPLSTPFGIIYGTNITPDPDTGIGRWSEAAFVRAMRDGVDRDGQHLYPAFPYDHFMRTADEDLQRALRVRDDARPGACTHARQPARVPARLPAAARGLEAALPRHRAARRESTLERRMEPRRVPRRSRSATARAATRRATCWATRIAIAYLDGGEAEGWTVPRAEREVAVARAMECRAACPLPAHRHRARPCDRRRPHARRRGGPGDRVARGRAARSRSTSIPRSALRRRSRQDLAKASRARAAQPTLAAVTSAGDADLVLGSTCMRRPARAATMPAAGRRRRRRCRCRSRSRCTSPTRAA